MNKELITKATGFSCFPAGQNSFRVMTPFTLGEDGKLLSFYLAAPSKEKYFITDAGETVMYAAHLGMDITKKRIEQINNTYSVNLTRVDDSGCIVSEGDNELLADAIWDYIKITMAIMFKKEDWQPRFEQEKFKSIVFNELVTQIGAEKVIRRAKIQAASGNMIEFPIGVKKESELIYVSPLALEFGKIKWSAVYKIHGQFSDVKATSDMDNRLAILEKSNDKKDLNRAESFLLQASKVEIFEKNKKWENVLEF